MSGLTAKEFAEAFANDVAEHEMTVLRDDGLYRHLRFARSHRNGGWFDLITWPGCLVVKGDMGGHIFSRMLDMFEFFRSSQAINPGYWAEKTPDGRQSVRKYSEDVLRADLEPHLAEYEAEVYPGLLAKYEAARVEYDALPPEAQRLAPFPVKPVSPRWLFDEAAKQGDLSHEDGARQFLRELEHDGVVADTWEWSLAEYTHQFLWCCHAIAWGIHKYDAQQARRESAWA
jgi:hypothetical protein